DLVRLGVRAERIRVVYCGIEAERFRPPTPEQRAATRREEGWRDGQLVVAFIGALGDRRKGFDTLYTAWKQLEREGGWSGVLLVLGGGVERARWEERARNEGLHSLRFLGFRTDVPRLLAGCDALVAPTRYESYGLGVVEALCTGVPALVSRDAGVAERYPPDLGRLLLLDDPEDAPVLARALRGWAASREQVRGRVLALGAALRQDDWHAMARTLVSHAESLPAPHSP
ncbi:MAG: glycosyltransferase family 4 protein, partial [Myxococcaceae bacterium]|nr:glycosyltransferase family 4 protein [Myxococcaceae bacterium]